MRIVSLACSNTEIVCALGCGDLLVGVDDHSDFPVDVVGPLPKVGPDLGIDVERVAALEPDLVLATLTVPGHEKVVERLEAAGLPWIDPEPVSLDDVYRDIRDIGARLGVQERAERLIDEMRAELALPGKEEAEDPDAPSRTAGGEHGAAAAGGRAVLGTEEVKSRPMTDEEVTDAAPDAVVLSWCGVHPDKYRPDVVLEKPAWADLDFVRMGHVYCIGEPFLGRPGPRLVDGVRAMRAVVETVRRGRQMS